MVRLHDITRRRICRAAFLTAAVVPTLAVIGWGAIEHRPGRVAAYERALEVQPVNPKALYGIGKVLDRLNRPDEATAMYRRSREMTGR